MLFKTFFFFVVVVVDTAQHQSQVIYAKQIYVYPLFTLSQDYGLQEIQL